MGLVDCLVKLTFTFSVSDPRSHGDYYNVEGSVGSRIAQQLQKGDKIRIGINGTIQSQDLKVKRWVKEDSYV